MDIFIFYLLLSHFDTAAVAAARLVNCVTRNARTHTSKQCINLMEYINVICQIYFPAFQSCTHFDFRLDRVFNICKPNINLYYSLYLENVQRSITADFSMNVLAHIVHSSQPLSCEHAHGNVAQSWAELLR